MRWLLLLLALVSTSVHNKGYKHPDITLPVCLAAVVKHEAGNQSLRGQRAVMDVVLNRMKKSGKDCINVATEPHQFSGFKRKQFYTVTRKDLHHYWNYASLRPVCKNCEWYHNTSVKPYWTKSVVLVVRVDKHLFYKERV